jgi:hypothetical protein
MFPPKKRLKKKEYGKITPSVILLYSGSLQQTGFLKKNFYEALPKYRILKLRRLPTVYYERRFITRAPGKNLHKIDI